MLCVSLSSSIKKTSSLLNLGNLLAYGLEIVPNHGPWDYKRQGDGKQYQDFGNFNFGATSAAMGIPGYVAQNGAGIYQQTKGFATAGEGIPLFVWPYGDDPRDANQIQLGRQYFDCGCK